MTAQRDVRSEPFDTVKRVSYNRPAAPPCFELLVIEGPDAGAVVTIDPQNGHSALVGSGLGCALRLDDPSVAARHCALELLDGRLRLVNLAAREPARVNGVAATEAYLEGGEIVCLGDTVLAVKRAARNAETLPTELGRLHGESNVMGELFEKIARLAETHMPLLLEGERGVGKRSIAEEIHAHSGRQAGSFVVVERGIGSEKLAEMLLDTPLLLNPEVGTVFIEEIADLDLPSQGELARAILDGRVIPRIVFATRGGALARDLEHVVASGRCKVPALRYREGDAMLIARHFWSELGGDGSLPDDFVARFVDHEWPGNVRELRVAVEDRIRHGEELRDSGVRKARSQAPAEADTLGRVIESDWPFVRARDAIIAEFERRYVTRALERGGGNVARAAAASGIAHRYFQVLKSRQQRPRGI